MKILVMEGQFSAPFIENQLIKPFFAKHPGAFSVIYGKWYDYARLSKVDCDIVIGHSLGGGAAIEFAKLNPKPKFITIDPRHMTNWGITDVVLPWLGSFQAPPGAVICNFYQRGFMSGYPVKGAAYEQRLWSTHFSIPGRKEVFECLKRLVGIVEGK